MKVFGRAGSGSRRAALLVAHYHRYDAIANDLRGIREILCSMGFLVRIFAPSSDPGLEGECQGLDSLGGFLRTPHDLAVLNYGGYWPTGETAFSSLPAKRVLRYHNITPGRFFAPYDHNTARLCDLGRQGLPGLVRQSQPDLVLSDSHFNALDILAAGLDPARSVVVPVLHQVDQLLNAPPKPATARVADFIDRGDQPLVLMTGRIVPNKAWHNFLRVAAVYLQHCEPRARFIMAGSVPVNMQGYKRELELIAWQAGITDQVVHLEGLTSEELAGLYRCAAVLLCCSEHEGFCVPLVEAMALRTPVIALDRGASAETLGQAGLLLRDFDEYQLAAAIHTIGQDQDLRAGLIRLGQQRYQAQFTNQGSADRIKSAITELYS
ncbi:MAG: glycosyltransferase [Leptospiraceae bacterium]|nr:glycosyltransferase [Leptospiraceae bacterium]